MRWQDAYRVGERVEVLCCTVSGPRWFAGVITRKTASGQPEVRTAHGTYGNGQLRKSELRPLTGEGRQAIAAQVGTGTGAAREVTS